MPLSLPKFIPDPIWVYNSDLPDFPSAIKRIINHMRTTPRLGIIDIEPSGNEIGTPEWWLEQPWVERINQARAVAPNTHWSVYGAMMTHPYQDFSSQIHQLEGFANSGALKLCGAIILACYRTPDDADWNARLTNLTAVVQKCAALRDSIKKSIRIVGVFSPLYLGNTGLFDWGDIMPPEVFRQSVWDCQKCGIECKVMFDAILRHAIKDSIVAPADNPVHEWLNRNFPQRNFWTDIHDFMLSYRRILQTEKVN